MRRCLCLLASFLALQSLVLAQNAASNTFDAKQLLQRHVAWEALPAMQRADELVSLERAYVYLRAGAEGEVRKEISNLTEAHPDALRFAMQADCWNPVNFAAGRDRANLWLKQFSGRIDSETQFVQSVQVYLGNAETRRQFVHDRTSSTSLYPVGSILFMLLIAAGVVRILP